jgi:hypothetical protein
MSCHISPLKNISKISSSMPHQLMSRHPSPLKNNSKKSRKSPLMPHHLSLSKNNFKNSSSMLHYISQLKNNSKNNRKIYYNSLRVINGEFLSMQACYVT